MRKDTLGIVMEYLFKPESKRAELSEPDQKLVEEVMFCYTLQTENPNETDANLLNALMNQFGITSSHAYNVMALSNEALGSVKVASKNYMRSWFAYNLKKAIALAELQNKATPDSYLEVSKIINKYIAAMPDEEGFIDAKKYVHIEKVEIVTDPTYVNVNWTEKDEEESRRLMEKYHISFDDDAIQEAETVETDE